MKENRNFSDGNESERIGYSTLNLKAIERGKLTLLNHHGHRGRDTFLNRDIRESDERNYVYTKPMHI